MAHRPPRRRFPSRAVRAGWMVLVVTGYLAAIGTTPTGQGWSLLPHLALDPDRPLAAPTLVIEEAHGGPVLKTLRHDEGLGERSREQEPDRAHPLPVVRAGVQSATGLHPREGVVHAPDVPSPKPVEIPTLSLDKHRVPAPTGVPIPATTPVAFDEPVDAVYWADQPVETPPPIG